MVRRAVRRGWGDQLVGEASTNYTDVEYSKVAAEQPRVSTILRRLDQEGWLRRLPPVPEVVRQRATRSLQRVGQRPAAQADGELPVTVVRELSDDIARLEDFLGGGRLWERTD